MKNDSYLETTWVGASIVFTCVILPMLLVICAFCSFPFWLLGRMSQWLDERHKTEERAQMREDRRSPNIKGYTRIRGDRKD